MVCGGAKFDRFESLNFDFGAVNYDTMKLIYYAEMAEILVWHGFLEIEKERKLQYQWYYNFRSYVVRVTGHSRLRRLDCLFLLLQKLRTIC